MANPVNVGIIDERPTTLFVLTGALNNPSIVSFDILVLVLPGVGLVLYVVLYFGNPTFFPCLTVDLIAIGFPIFPLFNPDLILLIWLLASPLTPPQFI
jgi:hypothetical protein